MNALIGVPPILRVSLDEPNAAQHTLIVGVATHSAARRFSSLLVGRQSLFPVATASAPPDLRGGAFCACDLRARGPQCMRNHDRPSITALGQRPAHSGNGLSAVTLGSR